jgi:hypothetical protein
MKTRGKRKEEMEWQSEKDNYVILNKVKDLHSINYPCRDSSLPLRMTSGSDMDPRSARTSKSNKGETNHEQNDNQ